MGSDEARRLDLSGWRRRDHYLFFKDFEQPFFNVCTDVDVTGLTAFAKSRNRSFFLAVLYLSLRAANRMRELRLRIRGEDVIEYPVVRGGTTVLREDETFGFGYFDYVAEFDEFERAGRVVLDTVHQSSGSLDDEPHRDDVIFYSVLPWIAFTSFAHARRSPATDSNPRIVLGKRHETREGEWRLPISVEVHHALVDGLHVGRFLESFQDSLDRPEEILLARRGRL